MRTRQVSELAIYNKIFYEQFCSNKDLKIALLHLFYEKLLKINYLHLKPWMSEKGLLKMTLREVI